MNKLKRVFITCLSFVSMASIVCHANTVRPYAGMSESLEIHILQLGDDEAPRIHQAALAAIKEMNVPDHQLLLTWAKLQRLLAATHFIENGLLLERSRDAIFVLLMDLDAALGGLLPLLASDNKDESILARAVIEEISDALKKSTIQPLPGTVPLLVKTLKSQDAQIRKTVARLLGIMPSHAEAAVPALINALSDEHYIVRRTAISTLRKIAVAIPKVHLEILKALMDLNDDHLDVLDALEVLALAIPEVQLEIVEKMIEMLNLPYLAIPRDVTTRRYRSDPSNFHVQVAERLQLIGAAAVPSLLKALDATDANVRHHAAIALAEIGSEHAEVVIPILADALASPYRVTQAKAVYALQTLGTDPILVNLITPILVNVLETTEDTKLNYHNYSSTGVYHYYRTPTVYYYGSSSFHEVVARVLAHINLPAVTELLRSENVDVRNLAVSVIAETREAVEKFEKSQKSK